MDSDDDLVRAPTVAGRVFIKLHEALIWPLATLLLMFAGLVMLLEAGDRTLFGHSFVWSEEAIRYSLLCAVFLCFGLTGVRHRHLRTDLLLRQMPKPLTKACEKLSALAGLIFCALLIVGGWVQLRQLMRSGITTEGLFDAPLWPIFLIMPIGIFIFGLYYLLSLFGALPKAVEGQFEIPQID